MAKVDWVIPHSCVNVFCIDLGNFGLIILRHGSFGDVWFVRSCG